MKLNISGIPLLKIFFFLNALVISTQSHSQSDYIEKLNEDLNKSKERNKSQVLNQLAYEWLTYDLDSAYNYANEALRLAQKYSQSKEEAMAWFNLGFYYELSEDLLHALESYNKSFNIYQFLDDKSGMASLASYIGTIYKFTGDYDLASKYFHLSLDLYMEIKDLEGVTYSYNNLGILYFKTGANEKATDAFAKSLKYAKILQDTLSLSSTYNNLGLLSMRSEEHDHALELFTIALELSKAIQDAAGIATAYSNIADVYMEKGDYDAALNYLNLVELNNSAEFNSPRTANNYLNLAQIYDKTNKPVLAEEYFRKALDYALEKNLKPQLEDIYSDYAGFLSRNNRHSEANEYLFKLTELKDSLYQEEMSTHIANANIRILLAENNLENAKLEKENELNELKLRTWKTSGIISVIALIIILSLLILINTRVVNLKRQKKALEEKNAEIEGLNIKLNELHEQLSQNMTHRTIQLDAEREKRYIAEKNLQKIHTELKYLQELKEQYIVNLNGEIRSSLDIIIGFSKLLMEAPDPETKKFATYVNTNAEHLYMALQSMKAFEMIEKNSVRLNKTEFNLAEFREQSIHYLKKLIPNLKLNENIESDLNTLVVTDRELLLRLVNDGIKFLHNISEKHCVDIDVRIQNNVMLLQFYCNAAPSHLNTINKMLSIEGGIELKNLSKEDAYLYSSLFYIQSLIKAFDFEINFSIENGTINISYYIPLKPIDKEQEEIKPEKDLNFAIIESSDKISTLLLQKKLEKKGTCEILSGIDYSQTDNLSKAKVYDMIFLDIPSENIQDWVNTAKQLEIKESLPPMVALSAYLTHEDIEIILNSGFSFYLNKPLKTTHLYKIIDQLND